MQLESANLGLGVSPPSYKLQIAESGENAILIDGANSDWKIGINDADSGSGYGSYNAASDFRLKKNIDELPDIFDRVMKLRPVKFHLKDQNDSAEKSIGFIAQEVLPN